METDATLAEILLKISEILVHFQDGDGFSCCENIPWFGTNYSAKDEMGDSCKM